MTDTTARPPANYFRRKPDPRSATLCRVLDICPYAPTHPRA